MRDTRQIKSSREKPATSLPLKFLLIALGLLMGVLLLEAGLRTAGFIYTSLQERANRQSLEKKDTYVIMCLGESTTALGGDKAYPRQLEEVLNERNIGVRFSVLNKGIAGTNVAAILSLLDGNLDTYRPDLVVTMMGVNDSMAAAGRKDVDAAAGRPPKFFERLRVYKLARLLGEHGRSTLRDLVRRWKTKSRTEIPEPSEGFSPFSASPENLSHHLKRGEWYLGRDCWELALPHFREALRLDPEESEALVGMGVCLREMGRAKEGEDCFRRALEANPCSVRALVELGNTLGDQGNREEANKLFRMAIGFDPAYFPAHQSLAGIAERTGDFEAAERIWDEAVASEPDNCEIRLNLAGFYGRQKKIEKAREACRQARDLCEDIGRHSVALGDTYAAAGDFVEAEKAYRAAAEQKGYTPDSALKLAAFYRDRERTEEEEKVYQAMIDANPDDHEAQREAALYYLAAGKGERGERLLIESIRKAPWDAIGFLLLGDYYRDLERWGEAIEAFRRALVLCPGSGPLASKLIACQNENGETAAARETLKKSLQGDPSDADLYFEWGRICADRGETAEAEKQFRAAMEVRPDDPRPVILLAGIYADAGRGAEAKALRTKAAGIDRKTPELYNAILILARKARERGEVDESIALYGEAIDLRPEIAAAYAELGQHLNRQHRQSEAEKWLRKAIEINPENSLALAELAHVLEWKGLSQESENLYRRALEVDPQHNFAFSQMVTRLMNQKRYREVEEICRESISVNPGNDRAWAALALCYESQGERELSAVILEKANEIRTQPANSGLARNYQALREIVRKRGVRLVCVQYPMRPLEQLTAMFPDREGIIFVDNEATFKQALRERGFNRIFNDNFGGDFGHCTPEGNRLLARNVADAILKEVFQVAPSVGAAGEGGGNGCRAENLLRPGEATVTASSESIPGGEVSHLRDGDLSSIWHVRLEKVREPAWVTVDFGEGEERIVRSLRVRPRPDEPDQFLRNAELLGSADGKKWETVAAVVQDEPPRGDEWRAWTFANDRAYRYYRLSIADGYAGGHNILLLWMQSDIWV